MFLAVCPNQTKKKEITVAVLQDNRILLGWFRRHIIYGCKSSPSLQMEKTAGSVWERMREIQGSLHRGKELLFVHKRVYCVCV